MFKLTINRFFDASHELPDSEHLYTKACASYHGHTYLARITLEGENNRGGMVIDFKAIKIIVDMFDHKFINNVFKENDFDEPSTAENVAKFIFEEILLRHPYLRNVEVSICEGYKGETSSSWSTYNGN